MMMPATTPTLRVVQILGTGAGRREAEAALERARFVLPFVQRASWLHARSRGDSILFVVEDEQGRPMAAAAAGVTISRALPGHRLYRIERLAAADDPAADAALLSRLLDAARSDERCLRVTIELFERDAAARARLEATLTALGFSRLAERRTYERTLALELAPGADALFANLNAKARRDVRKPAKRGLEVRPVTDRALAPRLAALMEETYRRTGGTAPTLPWGEAIEMSNQHPERSRISGLFDPATAGNGSLVGFAWGALNGAYVTYEAGASTRRADLGGTPLAYAPLWDLIAWAAETPAAWFDFGGVTTGHAGSSDDPLGGISDFKRYFCDSAVDVGGDWVFEPRAFRASIARAISAMASRPYWSTRQP
jgi:hypothetical protein